jgi:hypothetical protein
MGASGTAARHWWAVGTLADGDGDVTLLERDQKCASDTVPTSKKRWWSTSCAVN